MAWLTHKGEVLFAKFRPDNGRGIDSWEVTIPVSQLHEFNLEQHGEYNELQKATAAANERFFKELDNMSDVPPGPNGGRG